ncbi:MAG: hypothetical protein JW818_14275 [Pirellulales bacterium]|nr:hypothetical protein [Pirellulales bacterium]
MRYLVVVLAAAVALAGCHAPCKTNLPPAERMMHPGPGVDGPGPGVMMHQPAMPAPNQLSQVAFIGPQGMTVNWDVSAPGQFDSDPLVCPGRYNFSQGAIYRLKLTNISPSRPAVELYPTLEIAPTLPRTAAFLAHNAIPVQFTEEDFDQVLSGNMVTKVIYLPDPEFQELAQAGVGTLVSTRLDPGVDPIVEADRRGAILGVIRLGNRDLGLPGQPGGPADVLPASFSIPCEGNPDGVPMGAPMGMNMPGGTVPSTYISGVTGPAYGMPMCGTPIGLPGPPHVPMGVPAGLQKHVIKNHTRVKLPKPTRSFEIDVKQRPGMSYPKPVDRVKITEKAHTGLGWFHQPFSNKHEFIRPGDPGVPCEECVPYEGAPCEGGCDVPYDSYVE